MEARKLILTWAIHTFNRVQKKLPVKVIHYRLDWTALTREEQSHVVSIVFADERASPPLKSKSDVQWTMRNSLHHKDKREILRYRKHFYPYTPDDMKKMMDGPGLKSLHSVMLPDYIEDENGQEISMQDMLSCVAGYEVLICGEVESVLRLGIISPSNAQLWTTEIADLIYQFFSVVKEILRSRWIRHEVLITSSKESEKPRNIDEAIIPMGEVTRAIVPLFRQLYSKYSHDLLFRRTCQAYSRFCSNQEKLTWIDMELQQFEQILKGPIWPTKMPFTVQELLDMVSYGARILHSQPKDTNCEKKLKDAIEQFGIELIQYEFNSALRQLFAHVARVYHAIRGDIEMWTTTGGLAKPTKIDLSSF